MSSSRPQWAPPPPGALASLLAVLALACGIVAPAAARQGGGEAPAAGGFGERVDVALVNVDVWVSDKQGNPVTGLGAESFTVLHDGQPVPITHFVEVRGARAVGGRVAGGPAAAAPAAESAPPSWLVAYFDQSRLHPSNSRELVRGLEALLDSGSVEPQRVLILRQDRGLSVAAALGSSRQQLGAALAELAKGSAAGIDLESESRLARDAIRSAWEQVEDAVGSGVGGVSLIPTVANPAEEPGTGGGSPRTQVGGIGSGGGPDACGMFVNQVQPILDSWVRSRGQRVALTLANLSDTASFLAGLPGVKTLLYLSDGLDTQPGAALATYASDLCPAAAADLLTGAIAEGMSDRFLELTRHANTNRVTIHALQATGLVAPGAGSAAAESGARAGRGRRASGSYEARKRAAEREGLNLIAAETGGRTVFNRNEFGPEMVKIGEQARTYYSLAYEPPPAADGARAHRIEVRLADPSLDARFRRGYRRKSPEEWLTERIEGALNLGITDNPLAVRLGAGAPRGGEDGKRLLPLQVMVPVEKLAFLPQDGTPMAEITIKVLARSLESSTLSVSSQTYRIKGAPGATGWAQLPIEVELGPGPYLAAIGVQDRGSGEASFISTSLSADPGG